MNQGQCSSTWALAVAQSIESRAYIKRRKLVALSGQQILDCAGAGTSGCQGGTFQAALAYSVAHKLEPAVVYPYDSNTGQNFLCRAHSSKGFLSPHAYAQVPPNSSY